MNDIALTEEFRQFVKSTIPSVGCAELLLWLKKCGGWCRFEDVLSNLPSRGNIKDADAWRYLEGQAGRLVAIRLEREIRYEPSSRDLDDLVRTLARAYNERPVTLIRLIYEARTPGIQSFADAFRIRSGRP